MKCLCCHKREALDGLGNVCSLCDKMIQEQIEDAESEKSLLRSQIYNRNLDGEV